VTLCSLLLFLNSGSIKSILSICFGWTFCAFVRVWYLYKRGWIKLRTVYTLLLLFTFVLSATILFISMFYAYANYIESYTTYSGLHE